MTGRAWMDRAECAGIWRFVDWPRDERMAYCDHCPVRAECEEYGVEVNSSRLVSDAKSPGAMVPFGGLTEADMYVRVLARRQETP